MRAVRYVSFQESGLPFAGTGGAQTACPLFYFWNFLERSLTETLRIAPALLNGFSQANGTAVRLVADRAIQVDFFACRCHNFCKVEMADAIIAKYWRVVSI